MKKVVVEVGVRDKKEQQKAMKAVAGLPRIDLISMDMKQKKLTVIGEVDPTEVVKKLRKTRKTWHAEIDTVGPAKEPEKKNEGEGKKEAGGGGGGKKKTDDELVKPYQNYNPYMTQHYLVYSAEENPNSCVIF